MAKQRPRRLVIDADVARSAGESEHPISSACRKFLDTVLSVGHHVVMSEAIQEEWRRHRSRYSLKWLTRMSARRRVDRNEIEPDEDLRERIDKAVIPKQKGVVAKDVHLIEAAVATDRLVASQDERARRAFGNASDNVGELRQIVWINPTQDDEKPIDWLQKGAKAEVHRQLGA